MFGELQNDEFARSADVAARRVDRTGGLPLPDGFGARGAVVIRT